MAQTQDALSRNIIDLTDHDQDDSLQILSSAASRAEEAASRLANRFESAVLEKHRMYLAQLTPHHALASSTLSDNDRETPATNRVRRQAAVHASHTLTEVYKTLNPLEEKLQASTTTPKKLGRPRKDEWTPGSHGSRSTEESDVRRRFTTEDASSPTSSVGQGLDLDRHRKISIEGPLSSKKRKRPSLSLEPGSPSKLARTGGLQVQDSMPGNGHTSPISSHEPPLQTIRDCQRVMRPNVPNFRFTSKSLNQDFYSDSDLRLAEILEELISTISKNQKRRYKYALSKDQLKSICKAVTMEATKNTLPSFDLHGLYGPNDTQYEQIKRSVRTEFSLRVAQAIAIPPKTLSEAIPEPAVRTKIPTKAKAKATAENDVVGTGHGSSVPRITDLPDYLSRLENESLGRNLITSTHATSLVPDKASTMRSETDHVTKESPIVDKEIPATEPSDADFASDEPFPPGFDRGRFPAQRRRRGNKFYTPPRPQKTPKASNTQGSQASSQGPHGESESKQNSNNRNPLQPTRSKELHAPLHYRPRHDKVTELLIERAKSDPRTMDLLRTIASGKGTKAQLAEVQQYLDTHSLSPISGGESLSQRSSEVFNRDNGSNSVVNNELYHPSPALSPSQFQVNPSDKENGMGLPGETYKYSTKRRNVDRSRAFASINRDSYTSSTTDLTRLRQLANSTIDYPMRQQIHVSRRLPTALDPYLECHAIGAIMDDSDISRACPGEDWCSIGGDEQRQLVHNHILPKRIVSSSKSHRPSSLTSLKPKKFIMIESRVVDPVHRNQQSTASLLRHRELGANARGRYSYCQNELRLRNAEKIEPWRSWKGASGDVVTAAWASNSTTYAFGAAAHANEEDLQYNRPCNLLLGDLNSNMITELPDHRVDRPKPQSISGGPNAVQAVYDACDPMVYKTVTAIAFAPSGNRMYTASHDQTVKIWDTSAKTCQGTLSHNGWVTSIEASTQVDGLFATATKTTHDSIRIYHSKDDNLSYSHFSSSRAEMRPDWQIYPECLRWGTQPYTSHLLLAGFHQWGDDANESGQLMLWDARAFQCIKVSPSSQSVYAASWHPSSPLFATGGSPGNVLTDKVSTQSVVRTWDVRSSKRYTMEYECSALDMQDVTFSPLDPNIVTAGCTDGTTFVWDFRRPDEPLHRLRHGRPIIDWDHTRDREEVDTGVMMSLWGLGGTIFYTGSSDGMIKAWDIRRHPADVLVRNVAQFQAGVQCGALSPDGTNILVGDADGGIHILSSAPCGRPTRDEHDVIDPVEEPISLARAPDGSGFNIGKDDDDPGTVGKDTSRELIDSGQLDYDPEFGVTIGPNYCGPFAMDSRKEESAPYEAGNDKLQALKRKGELSEEIARQRRGIIKARKMKLASELSELLELPSPLIKAEASTPPSTPTVVRRRLFGPKPQNVTISSKNMLFPLSATQSRNSNFIDLTLDEEPTSRNYIDLSNDLVSSSARKLNDIEDNTIPESEMVEENLWWPRLGEDEIVKAKEKARLGRG